MYNIISINSGVALEQFDAKRLKTKRTDFDKFKLFGQNVVVEEKTPEVAYEEAPTYVEDNSYVEETPVMAEPSKISGIFNDFNLNEVTNPIPRAEVSSTNTQIEKSEGNVTSISSHPAWNNHGYTPQSIPSIAAVNINQPKPVVEAPVAQSTTTAVIDKINTTPKKEDIPSADYIMNLKNNKDKKFGPTANKVLDSETPELDKLIKLLEKLHSQLEELKAKKEELSQRKQDVLEGKASIDELLGKTMTLDLTAIQARAKALTGANDVIDSLRKSVEQIKEVGIASEDTIKVIERDIKNVEENITKTQEEIGNVEAEKTNKCAKIAEDLKAATSLDEKEELITKQLDILRKQKEALTGALPSIEKEEGTEMPKIVNIFDSMRIEEDEPTKARAAS